MGAAVSGARRLVLATRNAGKLRELLPLLSAHAWAASTLLEAGLPEQPSEAALEAFATFEENALAKARHFAGLTGGLVLADDSGLEVDALGGRPGVHSKRWCGRDDLEGEALDAANNAFLQQELAAIPDAGARSARYVCAAAAVWPGGELVVRGETAGRLLEGPRGSGGFGYDPYFWSAELDATFAEVAREAKAAVSHRGRAFRALLDRLDHLSGMATSTNLALPVDPGARLG